MNRDDFSVTGMNSGTRSRGRDQHGCPRRGDRERPNRRQPTRTRPRPRSPSRRGVHAPARRGETRSAFTSRKSEYRCSPPAGSRDRPPDRSRPDRAAQTAGRPSHGAACSLDFGTAPSRAIAADDVIVLPKAGSWTMARSARSCRLCTDSSAGREIAGSTSRSETSALGHDAGELREVDRRT